MKCSDLIKIKFRCEEGKGFPVEGFLIKFDTQYCTICGGDGLIRMIRPGDIKILPERSTHRPVSYRNYCKKTRGMVEKYKATLIKFFTDGDGDERALIEGESGEVSTVAAECIKFLD